MSCRVVRFLHSASWATGLLTALKSGEAEKISEATQRIKDNLGDIYKDYSATTDQKSTKAMLKLYRADVPVKYHPDFYTTIVDKKFKGNIDKFVDDMFARSIFASEAKMNAFLGQAEPENS